MGERFARIDGCDHRKSKAQLEIEYLMTNRRQDGRALRPHSVSTL